MGILDEIARLNLAVELLRRNARVSIAHHETGVPRAKLRTLHRELHGRGASCGQIPALGGAAIQTRTRQVHAGWFAALYRSYAGPGMERPLDVRALIAAYDLYRDMALPAPALGFNDIWVIAQDLRVGTAQLRACARCELPYLVAGASRLAPTCPLCALYARRGGQAAARLVLPQPCLGSLPERETGARLASGGNRA